MRIEKRPAKKAKNGFTYRIKIDYVDRYGVKQKYSKGGFETKKEARQFGEEMEYKLKNDLIKKESGMTLNECFLAMLEIERDNLARTTIISYMNVFEKHIKNSKLGNTPIQKVNYGLLQSHFKDESTRLKTQKIIIKKAITYAIRNELIYSDPLSAVVIPKTKKRSETQILTEEEFERLIDQFVNHMPVNVNRFNRYSYTIALYCGYYLGLRIGEILALEKDDFDLDAGSVRISHKLEYVGLQKHEQYISSHLKTDASYATLPVPEMLIDVLKRWFEYNPYDLVCVRKDGSSLTYFSTLQRWKQVASQVGIENFHPHVLRHTYASNIVRSGCDIKTASKLARHSNVRTTLDIYTHTDEEAKKDAIRKTFCPKNDPNNNSTNLLK